MEITNMILMDIGKGYNLEITREMVEKSIHTFENKPVVYNNNQELSDYTIEAIVKKKYEEKCVGIIKYATIQDDEVIGEVAWFDSSYIKPKYDNWCIKLSEDRSEFILDGVEIFDRKEEE